MNETEYYFEELPVLPGVCLLASGTATVAYEIGEPEPDVGIMSRYVEAIEVLSIELDPYEFDDKGVVLAKSDPLYGLIEAALHKGDRLREHCMRDREEWE